MPITISELRRIAGDFLAKLENERITSVKDLETKVGREFLIDNKYPVQEFVSITIRPSNFDTYAYTVSYVRPGTGIPMEIKVNGSMGYIQMILKAEKSVSGYSIFFNDSFDNLMQSKIFVSSDFSEALKELRRIRDLSLV